MADETATATTTTTATPNTVATTTTSSPKPGWKTSEFYFKIGAILLSSLFATGVIPTSGPIAMIAMIAATMLGAIGYTVSRTLVKTAAVPLMLLVLLIAPQPACTWLTSESKQVAHDVVDCTTSSARDATKQFGPVVEVLLAQATEDNGQINWAPVKDITKNFGAELGGCVLSSVVAQALHPRPADPNAPHASQLVYDPASLTAGFNAIRSAQLGGKTFRTDYGEL